MFAVFLGGPWDLTKRAMKPDSPRDYYVPQLKDAKTFARPEAKTEQLARVTRHEYRKMFVEDEYMIYIYQGIR